MDRIFRTPGQIEAALGLPCLSVVPRLQVEKQKTVKENESSGAGKTLPTASTPHWGVINMPLSRFAESVRSIKLGIEFEEIAQTSNRVIGITRHPPGEGDISRLRLAQLIAGTGKSVSCRLRSQEPIFVEGTFSESHDRAGRSHLGQAFH